MTSIYSIIAYCYGFTTNSSLTKLFCEMAIKINDSNGYNLLGNLYFRENNYDIAEKYYLKSVELNNVNSMHNLGILYNLYKKDYTTAIKYYDMATQRDCRKSFAAIGQIYFNIYKNYDEAIKYFFSGVKNNCSRCMIGMAMVYRIENNHRYYKKYLKMAIKQNNILAMAILSDEQSFSTVDRKKYCSMLIDHCNNNKHIKIKNKIMYNRALIIAGEYALESGAKTAKEFYFTAIKNNIRDDSELILKYLELCDHKDTNNIEALYLQSCNNIKFENKLRAIYDEHPMPISKAKIRVYEESLYGICLKYAVKNLKSHTLCANIGAIETNKSNRIRRINNRYNKHINSSRNSLSKNIISIAHKVSLLAINKKYDDKLFNTNMDLIKKSLAYESTILSKFGNAHNLLNNIPPYKITDKYYCDMIINTSA